MGDSPPLAPFVSDAVFTDGEETRTTEKTMKHNRHDDRPKSRKCSVCRERDLLTPAAYGYARLCRHCLMNTELVDRLERAALQAGYKPQLTLF